MQKLHYKEQIKVKAIVSISLTDILREDYSYEKYSGGLYVLL